jgi:hypothetical protein
MSTTSGRSLCGLGDGLPPVLRLADDFEAALEFEHFAQALAHDHVVFGQ